MNDLDKRILQALEAEDRELFQRYDEPSLLIQFLRSFRGRWGGFMIATTIVALAIGALGAYCIYLYFHTGSAQTKELASVGFICCVVALSMFKILQYNYFGNLNVMREIKRLELQISLLSEKHKE